MSKVRLFNGDSLKELKKLDDNSIDAIVTDPPYGISFMSKKWDYDIPSVDIWKECLRVLKPGGHALIACGTRTQHRMVVNIEDAGFEIRDVITWLYGSGFPKSHNISKAIDKKFGAERERGAKLYTSGKGVNSVSLPQGDVFEEKPSTAQAKQWDGWGTALKPAAEFFTLCRKPLSEKSIVDNVLRWGTGGINIDECRVEASNSDPNIRKNETISGGYQNEYVGGEEKGKLTKHHGCRPDQGRFPANLILDENINLDGAERYFYCAKASKSERNRGLEGLEGLEVHRYGAGIGEGKDPNAPTIDKNHHPTVKPIKLMEYLCKLITPKRGIVLDPFMGSGSTGVAAINLDFKFVGCELSEEYFEICKRRIKHALDEKKT